MKNFISGSNGIVFCGNDSGSGFGLGRRALNQIESFSSEEKLWGPIKLYWYDYPKQHFYDDGARQDDALQDHFPEPEQVSFRDVRWHEKQLQDCVDAGLDFIIPVYWGNVSNYFSPGVSFSIYGLPPLQEAIEIREAAGKPSPKIGMFYDTSTLLPGYHGKRDKLDLTSEFGRDIFYRTIRDYFNQIEPENWAAIDGRPLVVLYGSAFVASHDQSTLDYVYQQFEKDFGMRPYLIRDNSWRFESDATTQWGAALGGPNIFGHVGQIGPGYNDTAVPGRNTPIRDREDGNFYRWSWHQILQNPMVRIVLVETWNEMHEGTDICESVEFGRQYIDLTREYVQRFKEGRTDVPRIILQHPNPLFRPASDEGKEFKDAKSVSVVLGEQGESKGVWLVRGNEDGVVEQTTIDGKSAVRNKNPTFPISTSRWQTHFLQR